ncbi:MAG: bifunctional diaminohydroxyphosphoribosylaminopyrimidine deaminase/5-amino-6-(5-phosphoribosylamino)uracil reductase RibD [Deltaproteobacteria bacterium]|nr:bifunctional diaminohydroxyphosphoribosylaminopyrimidine deaminase/5-amino-6-(5-phosphoribosylamino)uracil reductase RibD [Deltaproteobacteria bacterium]
MSPNPMVGAVIVKENRIIGEGYHEKFGDNHAEINAILNASDEIEGSTIYVTLEPCAHHGKTPPCVERLISLKPARVVIGTPDPNPLVSGKGIKLLNEYGIDTTVGVLEDACKELNERFFKFIRTKIPYVTLKFAQTLDGRIATAQGHSQWISSLLDMGIDVMLIAEDSRHRIDMKILLEELGKKEISSILVEGGAAVITTVLREQLADRAVVIIAPKIVGKGIEAVGDLGIEKIDDALEFSFRRLIRRGGDLVINGRIEKKGSPQF